MAIINPSSQSSISDEFLQLASQIVRDSQSKEGALRAAVSRAYYSVFLTVRDELFGPDGVRLTTPIRKQLDQKFQRKKKQWPGSHERILFAITVLAPTAIIRPITLCQQISLLKEARTCADYYFTSDNLKDIPYNTWSKYANEMVALASQLLPVARKLPPYK